VNRGQMQAPHQQQQQYGQHAGQHSMQDSGPTNTSALSGVMFASLNLHPATLSGLHVSVAPYTTACSRLSAPKPQARRHDTLAFAPTQHP
jgi:hypothetical protein